MDHRGEARTSGAGERSRAGHRAGRELRAGLGRRDVRRRRRVGCAAHRAAGRRAPARPAPRRGADPARGRRAARARRAGPGAGPRTRDVASCTALLAGVDDPTAVVLARAFTAYFQLANVTEQLHRWPGADRPATRAPLEETVRRIGEALDAGRSTVSCVAPVLAGSSTARSSPPTPPRRRAARCSPAAPDRRRRRRARGPAPRRPRRAARERRLAELVDLLWQTDELRIVRPKPTDEARTALYYLRSLATDVVPDLLEELDRDARASIGVELPARRPAAAVRRLGRRRPGRQPQRHAAVTLDVLSLQHDAGLRRAHRRRSTTCSPSCRPRPAWSTVTDELLASLDADAEALPITYDAVRPAQRRGALPAQALLRPGAARSAPATGWPTAPPHEPGRDYREPRRAARRPHADPRLDAGQRRPAAAPTAPSCG